MLALTAVVLCAAATPVKLASPGLNGVQVSKELAVYYSDHLAQLLISDGLQVMTATDINALLGLERQKQMLGCSADQSSSCMAELANALGVDGIVTGSIGRFGDRFQINLKVVSASDGKQLAIYSATADSEGEVLAALKLAAAIISEQVLTSMGRAPVKTSAGARAFWWVPVAVAGVAAGTGIALLSVASGKAAALRGTAGAPSTLTGAEAQSAYDLGTTLRTAGFVSFGVAGAALLAAGAVWLFGGPAAVSVAPAANGGGGALLISGALP